MLTITCKGKCYCLYFRNEESGAKEGTAFIGCIRPYGLPLWENACRVPKEELSLTNKKKTHLPGLTEWGVCNKGKRIAERGFQRGKEGEGVSIPQTGSSCTG